MSREPISPAESDLLLSFARATDDLVTVVDAKGRFIYVNEASEKLLGLTPAECVGRSAFEFIHPEDRARTYAGFEVWAGGDTNGPFCFENRQVSVSGEVREMRWSITRKEDESGELEYLVSIASDQTEIRSAQRALAESRTELMAILGGALDPIITIESNGTIRSANASCETIFGYPPGELVGRNVRLLMPEPYRSEHDGHLAHYLETGETAVLGRRREFPVVRKDGKQITIELSVSRVDLPGQGEPVFVGSFRDITERDRAMRALAASERKFRAIFDQEYQFVGLMTPGGKVLELNRAAFEAIGVECDEAIGKPFWEMPCWADHPETQDRILEAIGEAGAGKFVRLETRGSLPGGSQRVIDLSIKPFRNEEGEVTLLLPEGRDITEIRQSQEREAAMLRGLAEIGESASILAHEIKNPITAVNLALRAVAKELGEDDQVVLRDLVERMQKLEKLMRRTMSLARPLDLDPTPSSVLELLRGATALLVPQLEQSGVDLEISVARNCPDVLVDRLRFEEVLTNLVNNAFEAMQGGGELRLEAYAEANSVVVCVDDSGEGLPTGHEDELFKAYFTTKAKGSGLGLAISRKIVEAHGGTIEARSSPLGGARFEIRLPRHQEEED